MEDSKSITLKVVVLLGLVPGRGLRYWDIFLAWVNDGTGKIEGRPQLLDSHWQEGTAYACAQRKAEQLGIELANEPVWMED